MLDDLILLRLLCAEPPEGGETLSRVSADVQPLAGDPGEGRARWQETFTAAVERLAAAGCLTREGKLRRRLRLTVSGGGRVRETFAVPADFSPTGGRRWSRTYARFAVPKALDTAHPLDSDGLRAVMLLRFYLPEAQRHAPRGLLAAVDLLLARKIGTKASPPALRRAALRAWITGQTAAPDDDRPAAGGNREPVPAAKALPEDPADFAALVRETARRSATGRFGENKVFVSHVERALAAAGYAVSGGREGEFKERLVRANTAGTLRLSRADLAGAHETGDVNASEIRYLGETFHFIRLD